MSECVVKLRMPDECPKCKLKHICAPWQIFCYQGMPTTYPMMPGCRFVCSLPEGHGGLADADKLMKNWQTWRSGMNAIASIAMIDQVIKDLRCAVIAPAEEA